MTTTAAPDLATGRIEPGPRKPVLALARIHLRLGSLTLARTELETLAGLGALDPAGLVDLAEVRWRTGDLPGAGEAATAAIDAGAAEPVALVIAAEAAALDGRLGEARKLSNQALGEADGTIDAIFAGMPRATIWPADAAEPPPAAATLFQRETDETSGPARARAASAAGAGAAAGVANTGGAGIFREQGRGSASDRGTAGAGSAGAAAAAEAAAVAALTLWDSDAETGPDEIGAPDPSQTLEAGRAALVAGSLDEAALRFGLALRLAPALAPAVLEATEGVRASSLIVVRGDAYRLVGHEAEARAAYALAAQGGLPDRRKTRRHAPKAKVATTEGGRRRAAIEGADGPRSDRTDGRRRRRPKPTRRRSRRPTTDSPSAVDTTASADATRRVAGPSSLPRSSAPDPAGPDPGAEPAADPPEDAPAG